MCRGRLFAILLLTIAVGLPSPAHAETRIALVIGNSAYSSGPVGSPKDDAKAIDSKLKSLEFQVTTKTDLKRHEFFDAIRDFEDRLHQQPGTVGLFYYSGHGMQTNNHNYMIPIDANIREELDLQEYGVSVENVVSRMQSGGGKANFIILDACRNNPFEKRFKDAQVGLAKMDAPASMLIAFSAEPGKVAEAASGGNLSMYTAALVNHIDKYYSDSFSMFEAVHDNVVSRSGGRQRPVLEVHSPRSHFSFVAFKDCADCPEMMIIPEGEFEMGSPGLSIHLSK